MRKNLLLRATLTGLLLGIASLAGGLYLMWPALILLSGALGTAVALTFGGLRVPYVMHLRATEKLVFFVVATVGALVGNLGPVVAFVGLMS